MRRRERLATESEAYHEFIGAGIGHRPPSFQIESVVGLYLDDGTNVELSFAVWLPVPLLIDSNRKVLGQGKHEISVVVNEIGRVSQSVRVLIKREVVGNPCLTDNVHFGGDTVIVSDDAADGRDELHLISETFADEDSERVRCVEVVPCVDVDRARVDIPWDDRGLSVAHFEPGAQIVLSIDRSGREDDGENREDEKFLHF